jgi:hypothetical protein
VTRVSLKLVFGFATGFSRTFKICLLVTQPVWLFKEPSPTNLGAGNFPRLKSCLARIFHENAPAGPKPPLWPLPGRLFGANPGLTLSVARKQIAFWPLRYSAALNQLSGLVQTRRILHDASRHAISGLVVARRMCPPLSGSVLSLIGK